MDLSKYIGEATSYDKKEKLEVNKPKSWLKSVSAFANENGGALIFGISDTDELIGLEDYRKDSEIISEIIKSKMDPIPKIKLENYNENKKYFIVLHIEAGSETPYYIIDGGNRSSYIRIGNQSVVATSIDLKNLVLKGMNRTFDTIQTDINVKDATFNKLRIEYEKRTNKKFEEKDLLSFGLITKDNFLTYAGALFADGYLIYQSRIFCTRWNGLTKASGLMEALDDNEFEGNILLLLENALNFTKVNTKKMWRKGPIYREEYPEYSKRAVQEAIVNALIHRDYSVIGSEVHIDIFDDRMEIYSPGGMYDGTLIQDVDPYTISSSRRNPVLADIFGRMDLMERRGSGLKKIIESYEFEKNYNEDLKPQFISTRSSFFTILKNLNYDGQSEGKNDGQSEGKNDGQRLKPKARQEKIIHIMKDKQNITALELSKLFSVSVSTIERDLKKLTDEKVIEYTGSAKDGYWIVKK